MNSTELVLQISVEVGVSVLLAVLGLVRRWFRATLDRLDPRLRPLTLVLLGFIWFVTNLFVLGSQYQLGWLFFLVTSSVMILLEGREVYSLWTVGVHGADIHAKSGVGYAKALRLCTNELDFLGTGAWKLTKESGFEMAVRRCQRPKRPVRFLLLDPEAGERLLEEASLRAGFDRDTYRNRVRESLRKLAQLKIQSSLNIEVRFHRVTSGFRLMFINDSLCLASYNVYGEGDGSQLPQLHIVKRLGQRDVESFYYPFRIYFDQLWEKSVAWRPADWK